MSVSYLAESFVSTSSLSEAMLEGKQQQQGLGDDPSTPPRGNRRKPSMGTGGASGHHPPPGTDPAVAMGQVLDMVVR